MDAIATAISAHLQAVHIDEASFTDDGQPVSVELAAATGKAEAAAFVAMARTHCRTADEVQAKLRYVLDGTVGERDPIVDMLLGEDGSWTTAPDGVLLTFLRSLLIDESDQVPDEGGIATAQDYAALEFEPYDPELIDSIPTNKVFGENWLMLVRCAVMTLTKDKPKLMEMFEGNEPLGMGLHDNLVECRDYLQALAEACEIASGRLLIAASTVSLRTEEAAA